MAIVAPTLNFVPGRGLRYAVSFDDQPPQIIDIVPRDFDARNGNRQWEESVKDACRFVQSTHTLPSAGYHTLKIWMVDPGSRAAEDRCGPGRPEAKLPRPAGKLSPW